MICYTAKLRGRFERHRRAAEVRREDDGTVPLLRLNNTP